MVLPILALPIQTSHSGARTDPVQSVPVGWDDEMDLLSAWRDQPGGIRPQRWLPPEGGLALRLPQVPDGWPYQYQWAAVGREAIVDLGRYSVLLAKVDAVSGYAHLDLSESDLSGKAVRGRRTPALTAPGIIRFDLGDGAKNVRRLSLRLIVGGPNEGATVVYRWVRFVSRETADLMERNPYVRVRFAP